MNTIFSIVIPLYNKEQSIKKTIESVLNQTYQNFEILIVNDGSTDSSVEIVSAIKDKRINIINKENGGVSSARNEGIHKSKFEIVAFLDGDDFWENNYLEEMNDLINDFPDCHFFGSNFYIIKDQIKIVNKNSLDSNFRGCLDDYFKITLKSNILQSSSIILKKDLIKKSGNFNENLVMGEDFDFWFRNALNSKIAFNNKPLSNYNEDDPNMATNKKYSFKKLYEYLFEIKKYENENSNLRILVNKIRVGKLPEILKANHSQDTVNEFINSINFKVLAPKYYLFSILPLYIKIILIKKMYK